MITERRVEERRGHLTFNETLLNTIPGPVFYKDCNGRYLGCNRAFEDFFGVSREWLVGKTVYDLAPMPIAESYKRSDEELLEKAGSHIYEGHVQPVNGEIKDVIVHKATFFNSDGSIGGIVGVVTDITERKKFELSLAESNNNFNIFFKTIDDLIIVATPDGDIIFVNEACWSKLGYKMSELITMNIIDLHKKEQREEASSIFAAMLEGELESCPLPLVTKTGSLLPVETRIWLGKWSGKNCLFGISKDLTKEQEAQQRFERLFRYNPAAMAISLLPDRTFIDVNASFETITGYSRLEVIGKNSPQLNLFPNLPCQEKLASLLETKGYVKDYELQLRSKDGKLRNGIFSGEIVESQGKKYFLTVMMDITERKQVELKLKESESLFRRMTENMNDMIIEVDINGIRNYVSPSHKTVLGWDSDYFVGKHCLSDIYDDDKERLQQAFDTCFREKKSALIEYRHYKSDGSYIWLESNGSPIFDDNGNMIGGVIVSRDITCKVVEREKRIKAEEELAKRFSEAADIMDQISKEADEQAEKFNSSIARTVQKMKERRLARDAGSGSGNKGNRPSFRSTAANIAALLAFSRWG